MIKIVTLRSFNLGYLCRERALTFDDCRRDLMVELDKIK